MATIQYDSILKLQHYLDDRVQNMGMFVVKNQSGKWIFALHYAKQPSENRLAIHLFQNEMEFAANHTLATYDRSLIQSYEDYTDLRRLRLGIQILFVDFTHVPLFAQKQLPLFQKAYPSLKEFPTIRTFNHPQVLEKEAVGHDLQFVEKCLGILSKNDNLLQALQAMGSLELYTKVPVLRYNQRTGTLTHHEEFMAAPQLVEFDAYRPFFEDEPDALEVPEFTFYRLMKQWKSIFPMDFEVQLSVSPTSYFADLAKSMPTFIFKVATDEEIICLELLDGIAVEHIQETMLEVISQTTVAPKSFISRGVYAQRLKNILAPILVKLGAKFKIVDELPILDRYDHKQQLALLHPGGV